MPDTALYVGHVRHRRFRPAAHRFRFPLFLVFLDLDRLPEAFAVSRLVSLGRWAWATFRQEDHFGDPALPLRERLRLDAAVTVPADITVDGEVGKQRLEGGPYAVARVKLRGAQYMSAWDTLMSEWLPGSGYQPDDRPCFEIHLNDPSKDPDGLHDVELCLAVKPL